jgi:hypothetical protein
MPSMASAVPATCSTSAWLRAHPATSCGRAPSTIPSARRLLAWTASGLGGRPRSACRPLGSFGTGPLPGADRMLGAEGGVEVEGRSLARVRLAWDRWSVWGALLDDPGRWLPLPAVPVDEDAWWINVGVGPVRHRAVVRVGQPTWEREICVRPLSWEPVRSQLSDHARGLPDFTGTIGARREDDGLFLEVTGGYLPPGGAVGARLDAAALHRVAEGTVRRFANEVTTRLQTIVTAR